MRHVQLATPSFVDVLFRESGESSSSRRETGGGGGGGASGVGYNTTFNYEKWVKTGTTRKVTGDFSLVA